MLGNKIRDGIHRDCHCSKHLIDQEDNDGEIGVRATSGSPFFFSCRHIPFLFREELYFDFYIR